MAGTGPASKAEWADGSLGPRADSLGISVVKTFKTAAPGITGFVVQDSNGEYGVIYKYRDFLISGALLDASGTNLTQAYAEKYIPKPDYAGVARTLAGSSGLINEGRKGAPEIYVFADPNCYYCRKLWLQTRDWVASGKLRIHWILVGFLKQSSAARAAAILTAANRAKALAKDEERFDLTREEGGIAELKPIPKPLAAILEKHLALMKQLRFEGTPSVMFKDVDGNWRHVVGVPGDEQLAAALGISSRGTGKSAD